MPRRPPRPPGASVGAAGPGGRAAGVGGGGMAPIMGIVAGALRAPVLAAVVAPLWIAGVLSGARSIYHYRSNARCRELEVLIDRLAGLGEALVAESSPALPVITPAG